MSLLLTVFCYSFFVGIAASMAFPALRPHWIAVLFAAVLTAAATGLAALPPRRAKTAVITVRRSPTSPYILIPLIISAILLGYARHASTFNDSGVVVATSENTGNGQRETGNGKRATPYAPLARHALRAPTPAGLDHPTSFHIEGIQHCLEPVQDEHGAPLLDAKGRWRFNVVVRHAECTATLPAHTHEAPVPTPFSVITSFTESNEQETGNGERGTHSGVSLIRLPNTVASFTFPRPANSRDTVFATVLGRIHDDPDIYNAMSDDGSSAPRTVLDIDPQFIQPSPGDFFYPVESGRIQVSLNAPRPNEPDEDFSAMFRSVSRTDALGNDVVVCGPLETPREAQNPDGFDYRKFLASHGIQAQSSLYSWQRAPRPSLQIVVPEDADKPRAGNPFVMFSLHLRDRMLRVVKETLPYPQSAFAGGITLGMRYGMQSAECALSDAPENNVQRGTRSLHRLFRPCGDFISDEFKRSGVNHVLAVSGLHVTIISALLVGIFTLLRANRKIYVPFVLLALVVFAVITGARPSTLRAVIMNGLFLILWAYLHESLKATILLSAAIAGFVIMLQSPRLLTDPSFTLSFGAILSLGLLTGPFTRVLNHFKGNDLLALAVSLVLAHAILARGWFHVAAPRATLCLALLIAAVFALGRLLARRGIRPIRDYGFANLPTAIGGFLAAQGAIQFGMMIPLSAYYFMRWPVVGSVANLIAIPLIGIVLQLSMLACIVGLIPYIGPLLALFLNAANWLGCLLFMLIAHFASAHFPYPFVRKPSGAAIAVYYLLVCLFILWPTVRTYLRDPSTRRLRPWVIPIAALLAALVAITLPRTPQPDGSAHLSVFSVGYGSSALYQTPDGRFVLFDTGYTQPMRSRASQAERSVLPRLASLGIRSLDALVILSDRPDRLDGAALVLEQCLVDRIVLPPALAACFDPETNTLRPDALDAALPPDSPSALVQEARRAIIGTADHSAVSPPLAKILAERRPSALNRFLGIAIRIESSDTAALPSAEILHDTPRTCAAVLGSTFLLAGDSDPSRLTPWLRDNPGVRAVSLPLHGTADLDADALALLASRGGYALLEYGTPPFTLRAALPRSASAYRTTLSRCETALSPDHVRSTERDGAIDFAFSH